MRRKAPRAIRLWLQVARPNAEVTMNAPPKSMIPSQTPGRLIKCDFTLLSLLERAQVFRYCLLLYIRVIFQLNKSFWWAARGAVSEVAFS